MKTSAGKTVDFKLNKSKDDYLALSDAEYDLLSSDEQDWFEYVVCGGKRPDFYETEKELSIATEKSNHSYVARLVEIKEENKRAFQLML